jgi:hypothetical protein
MDRSISPRITQRFDAGLVDASAPERAEAMPTPGDAGEAPPRADLRAYWRALVRYRWPILGFAAASTLLAGIAVSLATPVYRASALVLVEAQERRTVSIDSVYSGVSAEREHLQTQVELAASREVLLAAGAINSPKILEQSGIGQASRLQALGIAPLHDLPGVGENRSRCLLCRRQAVESTLENPLNQKRDRRPCNS